MYAGGFSGNENTVLHGSKLKELAPIMHTPRMKQIIGGKTWQEEQNTTITTMILKPRQRLHAEFFPGLKLAALNRLMIDASSSANDSIAW